MDFEIEKRTLGEGWVEIKIVTLRPTITPDFKLSGSQARKQICEMFLSGAAGVADILGFTEVSALMQQLWLHAEEAFRREETAP